MRTRILCLLFLVGLGIVDVVIPVPILGLVMIYVVLERPAWFRRLVEDIYGD